LFTVTSGKSNVGVAVTVNVGVIVAVRVLVGVDVMVGVDVSVGVNINVRVDVLVHEAAVAVMAVAVRVACCSGDGAQDAANNRSNKINFHLIYLSWKCHVVAKSGAGRHNLLILV
jgi:hypothetical protein